MSALKPCVICRAPRDGAVMCSACASAFDRWSQSAQSTHAELIEWAAKRARRAARRELAPLERQLQDALRLAREHDDRMSAGGGRR